MLHRLLSVFTNPSPGPSSLVDPENAAPYRRRRDDEWPKFRFVFPLDLNWPPPNEAGKIRISSWLDDLHHEGFHDDAPEFRVVLMASVGRDLARLSVRAVWHCRSGRGGKKKRIGT